LSDPDGVSTRPRDWDARTYDRVSDPQAEWAQAVLDRLGLHGDETVLDAGCGSGRITEDLVERLPRGRVIAVDAAPGMVEHARARLGDRARVFQCDLLELHLDETVDAVFSNAVFHWISDHDLLFRRLYDALRPGGRLVAQYGGEGNVARFHEVANEVAAREPFASHLAGWRGPWNFTSAGYARRALEGAGFEDVEAWIEPRPMRPPEPREFIRVVCLGHHLERLPEDLRARYVDAVADAVGDPVEIDYVRLNITARRGD
jgi:trans-aconitate 2-methyltransferase